MLAPLFFGLFGLVAGSFLNVLVLRYPEKPTGRSRCPHCKEMIRWRDNLPVVSWLILRGRCRDCRAPISLQYPLVELLTALVFFLIGASAMPLSLKALSCLISATLIAIAAHDLRTTVIPDPWVYLFVVSAFGAAALFGPISRETFLSGPIVALPLFLLWLYSRGAWMGFGDVKLALGIGYLLGYLDGLIALFAAFVLGAVAGLALIALTHIRTRSRAREGFTMKSEIPFGPFLAAGTFIIWFMLLYNADPLAFIAGSPW